MTSRTTVLLADDHVMLLEGLACLLRHDFDVLGIARNGRSVIDLARQKRPEVILMDIAMPSLNGIDTARILKREGCPAKILFLTAHAELWLVEDAFRVGASGFMLKSCDAQELINAIRAVARGRTYIAPRLAGDLVSSLLMKPDADVASRETPLTVRQREVLQLLAEGKTMKEAATVIGISTRTAESHKYEMMRLLRLETTADLIRYAVRIKLI